MAIDMDEEARKRLNNKSNPVRERIAEKCPIIKHINQSLDDHSELGDSLREVLTMLRKDIKTAKHPDYSAFAKVLDRLLRGYT